MTDNLTGIKWNLKIDLICIYLKTSVKLNIFQVIIVQITVLIVVRTFSFNFIQL